MIMSIVTVRKPCLTVLALLFLSAALPAPQHSQTEELIPFETIEMFSRSGVRERETVVITKNRDWKNLWKEVHSFANPKPPRPGVDFGLQTVIAVFAGEQGDSTRSISITKLVRTEEGIRVYTKESYNGPTCPPGPPIASEAYHIIITERIEGARKRVAFEEAQIEERKCQ
jgi:hypothetical protein